MSKSKLALSIIFGVLFLASFICIFVLNRDIQSDKISGEARNVNVWSNDNVSFYVDITNSTGEEQSITFYYSIYRGDEKIFSGYRVDRELESNGSYNVSDEIDGIIDGETLNVQIDKIVINTSLKDISYAFIPITVVFGLLFIGVIVRRDKEQLTKTNNTDEIKANTN